MNMLRTVRECLFTMVFGLALCLIVLSYHSVAKAADWPQWRGPNRDGKSLETGLLKRWPNGGPKLLWSIEGLGTGFSTVSVADSLLYTTGMVGREGILFAYDLQGNLKWKKSYGAEWRGSSPGVRTTPTVDQDRVYVMSGNGRVVCFDAKTGEEKWAVDTLKRFDGKNIRWGISESVLIDRNNLICTPGGQDATIVALDKMTGETVWISKGLSEKSCYSSLILIERGGNRLVATMTEDSVVGVNADTGKVLWLDKFEEYQEEPKDINPVTPVYCDGCVYTTSGYDNGGAMLELSPDGTKVSRKWVDTILDCHHGGVVIVNGYIYGANWKSNRDGNWVCLDWDSGKVMYEKEWICKGSITYADGMLYCYEEKEGTVALVKASPEGFDIVSSFEVSKGSGRHWAHPVVC
ncbi:MAG: outer membrane protein assembly factor BamB family protein, partial [Planctomycetota bacterium]